jgi:hypothetical protein
MARKAYSSSAGENRTAASLIVIQPRSSSQGIILIEAASNSLFLPSSLRVANGSFDL